MGGRREIFGRARAVRSSLLFTRSPEWLLPHRSCFLRGWTLPAGIEPFLYAWPLLEVDEEPAIQSRRDIQVSYRKRRGGEPFGFRERGLEHIERRHDLLPGRLGNFRLALGLRKLLGVPDAVHDLAVSPIRF